MAWGNIYRRRLKVFTVALIIYLDYKAVQKRGRWVNGGKRTTLWERAHERNAKRLLNLIIDLEGLWVKFGQYLSTRADVLPEAFICLLKQLQDSLPPRPLQEACRTIEKELGKSMDALFLDFADVPLATASIAQVHRATLNNGKDVVVKIRHEGIKEVILEDLKNAKLVVDWIAWAEPQFDFNPLIDEWCKEAPKELDFNKEAENTRSVYENLRKTKEDPDPQNHIDVLIPEVILSSEKVLILEYMDGYRLNDHEVLETSGVDKQKLVEEITRAYAHQIYVDGFFNGDPHPGNFLISREAPHRPILLDFGLTKSISNSMKQALAKMFLACAEGDHVALLSAFAEMGLSLRLDMPDQAMEVTNVFFRSSAPAKEAIENMKFLDDQRKKSMKAIQEKTKLGNKEFARFNPVDAFPGDAVIFMRVLNLLRGLSSMLNVHIVYLDIMRPFAEAALHGTIKPRSAMDLQWIYNSPVLSNVEAKLRQLLLELGNEKILGIQVCAYKDGKVMIDTAAGIFGKYDPRPVQPDTLFPVFSVTKGITSGMLHTLVDAGKLKLEEKVANIWPGFGANGKDQIKVHHVLNHASGLHNALADVSRENPLFMCEWDECLNQIAKSAPETEPGRQQLYHYLSFGWLCGGIIEHASGKRFQEVLEEAIIHPLKVEGELYIGVPPGVESRLATLTLDIEDLNNLSKISGQQHDLPSTFQGSNFTEFVAIIPVLFNTLAMRRAIIPAANGHCSARALARYYAALVNGGEIPPPHAPSELPLGSHSNIPQFPPLVPHKRKESGSKSKSKEVGAQKDNTINTSNLTNQIRKGKNINNHQQNNMDSDTTDSMGNCTYISRVGNDRIFSNPRIHQAFLGVDEYEHMVLSDGKFGLGFRRLSSIHGSLIGFGHSGIGGSTSFCNIEHRFAMAVTVNKMSLGTVTRKIIQLVCSELNVPLPVEFSTSGGLSGVDMQPNLENALIN